MPAASLGLSNLSPGTSMDLGEEILDSDTGARFRAIVAADMMHAIQHLIFIAYLGPKMNKWNFSY